MLDIISNKLLSFSENGNPETTSHCGPALTMFNHIFYYSLFLVPTILEWDPTQRNFTTKGSNCRKYFPWYFNVFGICMVVGFGSCLVIISNVQSVSPALFIVTSELATFSVFLWGLAFFLIRNTEDLVYGMKTAQILMERLSKHDPLSSKMFMQNTKWRWIALSLKFTLVNLSFIVFVLVPPVIIAELDPFLYTLNPVFPENWTGVVLILRVTFGFISVFEACRFFALIFPASMFVLEMLMHSIFLVASDTSSRTPSADLQIEFVKWYSSIQIASLASTNALSELIVILYANGFIILVSCNIVTATCYSLLPIFVYWLMPIVSLISATVTFVCFFTLASVQYESANLLRRKRLNVSRFRRGRIFERSLVALRPVAFRCGSFFTIQSSMTVKYFYHVLLRTVDGILFASSIR